ncbi:hypothetical protein V1511DRAFT_470219 [Dipodascopsis uninucleata]
MTQKDTENKNNEATNAKVEAGSSSNSLVPNGKSKKDEKDKTEEELSEEDQQLKSELEMLIERLTVR